MKVSRKDFAVFKKEFLRLRKEWGLTGYEVYFRFEPLEGCFARIDVDVAVMVTTVTFNSEPGCEPSDPKKTAMHEALHLLISRLEAGGRARFLQSEEITESTEELVNKLISIIGGVSENREK